MNLMTYKVQAWLLWFQIRDQLIDLRAGLFGHAPTWLIVLYVRARVRRKHRS